jgi:hypothetical protein
MPDVHRSLVSGRAVFLPDGALSANAAPPSQGLARDAEMRARQRPWLV